MTESKKAVSSAKPRPSRRGKVLTSTEKAEAIALWRAGSVTLDQLAERFHRDRNTFIRLFNKEGVTKGEARAEHEKKVTEAVENASVGDVAITAARIRETNEWHYKVSKGFSGAAYNLVTKAISENRALSTIAADLKALKTAMEIQVMARGERYGILGLNDKEKNDDSPLPPLVIQELTAQEIKQMHKSMEDGDDLAGIADMDTLGDLM